MAGNGGLELVDPKVSQRHSLSPGGEELVAHDERFETSICRRWPVWATNTWAAMSGHAFEPSPCGFLVERRSLGYVMLANTQERNWGECAPGVPIR